MKQVEAMIPHSLDLLPRAQHSSLDIVTTRGKTYLGKPLEMLREGEGYHVQRVMR